MDAKALATYRNGAAGFLAFSNDLIIPSGHGPRRFGDVMADFQRERFQQIGAALEALAVGDKPPIGRYWWEATKGASKDSDLAVCLLWLLAFARRSLLAQVGAADADQADELRKAAKDILALNPWLADRLTIQAWKIVCDGTGATCEIVAADVAGSHGARPDVLVINELSHISKPEFAENLRDNAAKVPNGLVVIATNAGFTGTWQWKWREIARNSARWICNTWAKPSPWLDPAEIEEARQRNSNARFMRLWWGVWSSGAGDAFDEADLLAAIDADLLPMNGRESGFAFAAGLDLGIKHDHSALVGLGHDLRSQRVRLANSARWAPDPITGKVDLMAVEEAVIEANRIFKFDAVGYDPWQAELMAQRLKQRGVRMVEVVFNGQNLNTMATTLLEAFRGRRIDLYDEPRLIADLRRLTILDKSYGHKLESVRDADGHADTATAFAIGLPLALKATRMLGPWKVINSAAAGVFPWLRSSHGSGDGMTRDVPHDGRQWGRTF